MDTKKESKLKRAFFACVRFALLALFVVQALALYLSWRDVEFPDFLRERVQKFVAPTGTRIEIDSIKISQLSRFLFGGVRIYKDAGMEEIISFDQLCVNFNVVNFFSHGKNTAAVFASGVEIACPAAVSGTAKRTVVVSDGRADFIFRGNYLHVSTFQGKFGGTQFSASGDLPLAVLSSTIKNNSGEKSSSVENHSTDSVPATDNVPGNSFYVTLVGVTKELENVLFKQQEFGLPKIYINADFDFSEESNEIAIDISALCENYVNKDLDFELKNISLDQSFIFNAETGTLSTRDIIRVNADSAVGRMNANNFFERWDFAVERLNLAFDADFEFSSTGTHFELNKIGARAGEIRAENFVEGVFSANSLISEIFSEDFFKAERFSIIGNVFLFGVPVVADVKYEESAGTRICLSSLVDLPALLKVPRISKIIPKDLTLVNFFEPPTLNAEVKVSSDFKFVSADYSLSGGPVSWRMVDGLAICSYGKITPELVDVKLIKLIGETYCTNVRVFTETKEDGKFRVQAFGSLENPEALDDYLGWFWWRIWSNIKRAPSPTAPRADIDVYGKWGDDTKWEYVYGSIVGENALGGGVLVDKLRLRVAEEPNIITAFDMGFVRGKNTVTGTLQWHYEFEPEYHFRDFRCAFTGTMPPHDVFKIVGEGLPEAFSGVLEREAAGTADVRVFFSGDEKFYPQTRQMVEVDVLSAPGKFSIFGIKGEDFKGKINYDTGNVNVDFTARNGGGEIGGNVHVNFPIKIEAAGTKLALNIRLKDVPGSAISDTVSVLKNALDDSDKESEPVIVEEPNDSEISKLRVSASFAGTMVLPDVSTLEANGSFSVNDPGLFDLQIFGDFSRLLETIKIPLTSFAFTDATSDYTVSGGNAKLPNLRIFGDSGEIDANVTIRIEDQGLAGTALFKNRRFTGIPLIGTVVDWMSNSTRLLPIEISGTLENVRWKLRPFSSVEKDKPESLKKSEIPKDNDNSSR